MREILGTEPLGFPSPTRAALSSEPSSELKWAKISQLSSSVRHLGDGSLGRCGYQSVPYFVRGAACTAAET